MKLVTTCTCFALAAALLAGCSSSEINRRDEAERFRAEMDTRVAALKIDPKTPLAMERCVEIALANNLDQKIRSLRESLQDEQVRLAMAGFLPKGSATYTQTHRSNPALTESGGVEIEYEDRSIKAFTTQFIMPVFDWGATYFAYTIAKDRRTQERLMVERATQTLVRDVRLAYNRLASAQRQEKLARIAPLAAKELLKVAQSLEREGLGSRASTTEVEAMLAQAALQWSMLRRQVEQARMTLSQTMSLPAGVDFAIDDRLPQAPPLIEEKEIAALEESALRNRPELRVQDMERRIAANTLRKEFAQFFPRFDGIATYNWTSAASAVNPAYWRFGFQIADSLLNGTAQIWTYRMADKNVDIQAERTVLLSLAVLYEVDLRVLQLYVNYDAMRARETVVKAQQESLKQIVSRYVQGLETSSNAVRSLAEMYAARLQLDQSQTDYRNAWFELETAALPDTQRPYSMPATPQGDKKPVTALPSFEPAPSLDALQKTLEAIPPVDLKQFPELEELLKASSTGGNEAPK